MMGGREVPPDGVPAYDHGEGGIPPLPNPGYERVPPDLFVPEGERTPAEEAEAEAYKEGYMSGVEATEAEATRLRARLSEAEARLAAKERHPANNPAERVEISIHKTYDVLEAIADEMKMIRRDIGSIASIFHRREGTE